MTPYLNTPLRTIEQAMQDSAHQRFIQRGGEPEAFPFSQEFRNYRYEYRLTVNGHQPH